VETGGFVKKNRLVIKTFAPHRLSAGKISPAGRFLPGNILIV